MQCGVLNVEKKINNIRLKSYYIKAIKETAKSVCDKNVKVYIFGSRTDLNKKGGDIDILIKTDKEYSPFDKYKIKLNILKQLYKKIGEQKIDVIITSNPKKEIEKIAIENGVEI